MRLLPVAYLLLPIAAAAQTPQAPVQSVPFDSKVLLPFSENTPVPQEFRTWTSSGFQAPYTMDGPDKQQHPMGVAVLRFGVCPRAASAPCAFTLRYQFYIDIPCATGTAGTTCVQSGPPRAILLRYVLSGPGGRAEGIGGGSSGGMSRFYVKTKADWSQVTADSELASEREFFSWCFSDYQENLALLRQSQQR